MKYKAFVCATYLMLFLLALPANAEEPDTKAEIVNAPDTFSLNDQQKQWVKRIIPDYQEGQALAPGSSHCLGKTVLPGHQRNESWIVTDVQVESAKAGVAHAVIVWLYPASLREGPSHYPRSRHVLLGLLALAKDEEILAIGKKLLTRENDQSMRFIPPLSMPSLTLWGIEEVTRNKGKVTRNHVFFRKRKTALFHAGTVPVLSSNTGLCGTFERARKKKRGLAGKEHCKNIWHFKTSVSPLKHGLLVKEDFIIAKSRRYKARNTKKTIRYEFIKGRLKPNRKSLRNRVPSP